MIKTKKMITNPTLKSWLGLNDALRDASENDCQKLLKEELKGRKRNVILWARFER